MANSALTRYLNRISFILIGIILLFSCEKSNHAEPSYCWECVQVHIAPNEYWKTYMFYKCGISEESINLIIKSNTYSNRDSTRQEILTCEKKSI